MISLEKCNRLIDDGFSLITVGKNKQPNYSWKSAQTDALNKEQFEKQYSYNGGHIKKDGTEMQPTSNIGLVTGYDFLECIDIDLKVFSTSKEQHEFWDNFLSFVKDNIFDFDDKFVVAKTQNAGYHIIYKSKRVQGNTKIATLKGHKSAVIESRGVGGYIFLYEKFVGKNTYSDVQFITDNDRDIIWNICQSYNYVDVQVEHPKVQKEYKTGLTAWDDFNQRTSIFDIIGDEFKIVRQTNDKYIIKRIGSDNVSAGSVFISNGCMYLFTTGSSFPHEKLVSPFVAQAYKYYSGDLSACAKALYKEGYGDRIVKETIQDIEVQVPTDIEFPIDIFPEKLQRYILASAESLNFSVDYMGASLLFLSSVIIGNSIEIEPKHGWRETCNLWISLIGKAGIGKTPSINAVMFPLSKINSKEIKAYIERSVKYEAYMQLSDNEKKVHEIVKRPKKTQFIVNDITLEALVELHDENKNGIGVLKDELAGWFKDMNKYRAGSDLEHWLSSWSGKEINLNRKTAKSNFVERAFIPILGGIQPDVLENFYTDENKANGFLDRMLFVYPEIQVDKYSDKEIKLEYLEWYESYVLSFWQSIKNIIQINEKGEITPHVANWSEDAKQEWIRIFNKITDSQNSDAENEYMKSMLPKQKSYVPRFALLLNCLNSFEDEKVLLNRIEKKSILDAEKLSDYFIKMSKKIKVNSNETMKIKRILQDNERSNEYEKFVKVFEQNTKASKQKLAEMIGVSRQTIYNFMTKYEQNKTQTK